MYTSSEDPRSIIRAVNYCCIIVHSMPQTSYNYGGDIISTSSSSMA